MATNLDQRGLIDGGRLSYATAATVTIGTAGETSIARDSTNIHTLSWSGTLTADITLSGAGGLDTGLEAANTWYAVHVVGDTTGTNTPKALLSLSATAPTLPAGYNVFRRLGWVRNNATSNFLKFQQFGRGHSRQVWYDENRADLNIINGGTATVWTDLDVSSFVPPTSELGIMQFINSDSSAIAFLRPDGFNNMDAATGVDGALNLKERSQMNSSFPCPGRIVEYKNSAAAGNARLDVLGFHDEL